MTTTNKRVLYVGGLADEVDEKVLQVNYLGWALNRVHLHFACMLYTWYAK